jgi:hypothetical protein
MGTWLLFRFKPEAVSDKRAGLPTLGGLLLYRQVPRTCALPSAAAAAAAAAAAGKRAVARWMDEVLLAVAGCVGDDDVGSQYSQRFFTDD